MLKTVAEMGKFLRENSDKLEKGESVKARIRLKDPEKWKGTWGTCG